MKKLNKKQAPRIVTAYRGCYCEDRCHWKSYRKEVRVQFNTMQANVVTRKRS